MPEESGRLDVYQISLASQWIPKGEKLVKAMVTLSVREDVVYKSE
jgi:hypothetical protein